MKFNKLGLLLSIVIILIIIFIITYSCTCKKTNNYENFISQKDKDAKVARENEKFKLNKAAKTAKNNYDICFTKYDKLLKVYIKDNIKFNTIATKWSQKKVSKSDYDEAYAKNLQNYDDLKAKEIECNKLKDIRNNAYNDWQDYNV